MAILGKEVFGVIYKIENIINNKVYIGQTARIGGFDERYGFKGNGIERVYNFHKAQCNYGESFNKHLTSSIEKYGFDAFVVDKKFDIAYSKDELDDKEVYWIKFYNSTDKNYGYNKTTGGEGATTGISSYLSKLGNSRKPLICIETNEIFLTLREAEKETGIQNQVIGRVCKGKSNYAYSKVYGKKLTFKYIYDLEKKFKKIKRPVICLTTNEKFNTLKEASDFYNIDNSSIIKNCDGKSKSVGKHPVTSEKLIWKYLIDYRFEEKLNSISK